MEPVLAKARQTVATRGARPAPLSLGTKRFAPAARPRPARAHKLGPPPCNHCQSNKPVINAAPRPSAPVNPINIPANVPCQPETRHQHRRKTDRDKAFAHAQSASRESGYGSHARARAGPLRAEHGQAENRQTTVNPFRYNASAIYHSATAAPCRPCAKAGGTNPPPGPAEGSIGSYLYPHQRQFFSVSLFWGFPGFGITGFVTGRYRGSGGILILWIGRRCVVLAQLAEFWVFYGGGW